VKSEVLTAATVNIPILLEVTPHSLEHRNQCFRGMCSHHLQGRLPYTTHECSTFLL